MENRIIDVKIKNEIDRHLHAMAKLEATLGTDSTNEERMDVMREQDKHLLLIKNIDSVFYETIK